MVKPYGHSTYMTTNLNIQFGVTNHNTISIGSFQFTALACNNKSAKALPNVYVALGLTGSS